MNAIPATAPEKAIVYVREAVRDRLPDELRETPGKIYSVNDAEGNTLALTADRKLAFALARRNDMTPVSAH